jgi:hypothetical protein
LDLERPAMAILRSSHKAGQTKPQDKPLNELTSGLGQRSRLAAPKYADSTKRVNAQVWGRWTEYYVYPSIHRHLEKCAEGESYIHDSLYIILSTCYHIEIAFSPLT